MRRLLLPISIGVALTLAVLAGGCQPASQSDDDPRTESTKQMAQRLDQIAQRTAAHPREQMYANAARVQWLRSMRPPQRPRAVHISVRSSRCP